MLNNRRNAHLFPTIAERFRLGDAKSTISFASPGVMKSCRTTMWGRLETVSILRGPYT